MTLRVSQPVVRVMVNGQGPFLFTLDTGLGDAVRVDSSFAAQLHLTVMGTRSGIDLAGRRTPMRAVRMDSIAIGGVTFRHITALSRNYQGSRNLIRVDGALGFGLFARYLLTIDYPGLRVRVAQGRLPPVDGGHILALSNTRGVPSVDLIVGVTKIRGLIDSGNLADGFMVPASLAASLNFTAGPSDNGTIRTLGSAIDTKQGRVSQTIRLGAHEFSEPTVIFPNFSGNASLGSPVLSQFAVTFDQRNHRVLFATPAATAR
jgi:hypothetical protein